MDIGLRDTQEDCLLIDGQIVQERRVGIVKGRIGSAEILLAVCDGMGGHSGGEWASRFVCERLKDFRRTSRFLREATLAKLREIQHELEEEGMASGGSTLACVEMKNNAANIYNIGDSRVYKLTERDISVLSHDHSLVQSMVDKGYLSNDEGRRHPYRNVLEFGLGGVFAKQWRTPGRDTYSCEDVLNEGEYCLLCSDGVCNSLTDNEMHDLLIPDPFGRLNEFVVRLREGMHDNASLILIGNE